jgi:hypothetical protein
MAPKRQQARQIGQTPVKPLAFIAVQGLELASSAWFGRPSSHPFAQPYREKTGHRPRFDTDDNY